MTAEGFYLYIVSYNTLSIIKKTFKKSVTLFFIDCLEFLGIANDFRIVQKKFMIILQ